MPPPGTRRASGDLCPGVAPTTARRRPAAPLGRAGEGSDPVLRRVRTYTATATRGSGEMTSTTETLSNFIDGERSSVTGETEAVLNPATGEELAHAPISSAEEVDRAVGAARRAFGELVGDDAGAARAGAARARRPRRGARRGDRALEALNAGKPIESVVNDEIPVMADNLRFFAGAARCLEGRAAGEYMEGYTSFTRREAVGVIGQVTPWNYPLMMAIWKFGPALAAGNTVVLKPAETTPMTTVRLAELAADILPEGVLNVVSGPGAADRRGADHPPRRGHARADRLGGYGQALRAHRRGHAQARAPRARRQGAGGRLRRRQPGERDRDDRGHRLLQRRPGLHRGDARARRREASTTMSSRGSPSRPRGW